MWFTPIPWRIYCTHYLYGLSTSHTQFKLYVSKIQLYFNLFSKYRACLQTMPIRTRYIQYIQLVDSYIYLKLSELYVTKTRWFVCNAALKTMAWSCRTVWKAPQRLQHCCATAGSVQLRPLDITSKTKWVCVCMCVRACLRMHMYVLAPTFTNNLELVTHEIHWFTCLILRSSLFPSLPLAPLCHPCPGFESFRAASLNVIIRTVIGSGTFSR